MKSKLIKVICLGLAASMVLPFAAACSSSSDLDNETRALTISSGSFDGVFNPFFASSAYDSTVVSQTQISMLGSDAEGKEVTYGVDEPVVTLDYSETMYDVNGNVTTSGTNADVTVYQMVIKNDIYFSDGVLLTAHDVLFNLYVYLDPNYTGSSTLYSTDIQGLNAYLAQDPSATEDSLSSFNETFTTLAELRSDAIIYYLNSSSSTSSASQLQNALDTYNAMRLALFTSYDEENGTNLADSYVPYSVSSDSDYDDLSNSIESDIEALREQFLEDLTSTYNAVDMSTYTGSDSEFSSSSFDSDQTWQGFFYELGLVSRKTTSTTPVTVYAKDSEGKYIIDWDSSGISQNANYTAEEAIEYAYTALAYRDADLASILSDWDTGTTMRTNFASYDKELYFSLIQEEMGGLAVSSISGISIRDASEFNGSTTYAAGEYEMLQIVINGVDPRAKWNFAFTVAPMHYYTTAELNAAAMADTEYSSNFGIEFSSTTFMNYVKSRNGVPVGAGVYQATTVNDDVLVWETDEDGNPTSATTAMIETISNGFYSGNIVYLVRNEYFETTGGDTDVVYNAKIKHLRYQVSSTTNTMTNLVSGTIDIADPTANEENIDEVNNQSYLDYITVRTAGYGYIGFNAKYIPNIYIRRALMTVMDITLVQDYYPGNLSSPLYRCFSRTSWVYEADSDYGLEEWEPESYYGYDSTGATAIEYLQAGGCTYSGGSWYDENGDLLEFTFTIAGDTTNHPANLVFLNAISILEDIGIQATVVTDSRALYKLASGGLAIWAAAWSSSVDPDMYQVYHKDSRATSVLNWGYDYLITENNATTYERSIINELSDLIDEARETIIQSERAEIYRDASDLVMELAVELPLYQRSDMYVYNNTVIDASTLYANPTPYMSPISEIWKISYLNN